MDSAQLRRDPSPEAERTRGVLQHLNLGFAVLFSVELVTKITALGVRSYACDPWNDLDLLVVLISWLTFSDSSALGAFKSLRTLRGLRPLRLISRVPAIQIVIEALGWTFCRIANVLFVLLIIQLLFAVLGVQIFGGRLASCMLFVPPPSSALGLPPTDPTFRGATLLLPMQALPNKTVCEAASEELTRVYAANAIAYGSLCDRKELMGETRCHLLWHNPVSGFEHVGDGLVTLMEIATLQGWAKIMHRARNMRGLYLSPGEPGDADIAAESEPAAAIFFIAYILVVGFLLIKLFVATVIDNFNRIRDKRSGYAYMTEQQKEWVETRKLVQASKPLREDSPPSGNIVSFIRGWAFKIVTHRFFELLILSLICANVLLMMFIVYLPPWRDPSYDLSGAATLFSWIFFAEAMLKLFGLGPRRYFENSWNWFDFFVTAITMVDILSGSPSSNESAISTDAAQGFIFNPMLLRVLRMFRILRLIRLVRNAKGLRTLLNTVLACAPSIAIIIALLAITCVIFAAVGMNLFGDVIPQPSLGYGGDWPAFDNFGGSMLIMVVMATSERWPALMRACAVQPPFCGTQAGTPANAEGNNTDCGAPTVVVVLFFVLFQLLGALLMLNLMVGVVVDEFSSTSIRENMRVSQICIAEVSQQQRTASARQPAGREAQKDRSRNFIP